MKYYLLILFTSFLAGAAAQKNDKPVQSANKLKAIPPGFKYAAEVKNFAYVPGGSFVAGRFIGGDSMTIENYRTVSVGSFYLARTEVSNGEYREFTNYVRDSIAHTLLGHFKKGSKIIDWKPAIDWKAEELEPMMLAINDRIFGRREVDADKLAYRDANGDTTYVYPDTLVWIRDFNYSYNDPLTRRYFTHKAFSGYPVVGVRHKQAVAYCNWKMAMWNRALGDNRFSLRLPTSAEWEYAAGGASPDSFTVLDPTQTSEFKFLMSGDKTPNKGYRYNFGMIIDINQYPLKFFQDDGTFYTAACRSYKPSDKGLFNLQGNVAEWTSDWGWIQSFPPKSTVFEQFKLKYPNSPMAKLNVSEANAYLNRFRVVKGGSWASGPFYLQPAINEFFLPEATHSYLGFRVAMDVQ